MRNISASSTGSRRGGYRLRQDGLTPVAKWNPSR
jgi:hypothetical protein